MSDNTAHIHRFRDLVTLAVPGGGTTIYLTPGEAMRLSTLLSTYARDVDLTPFRESTLTGHELAMIAPHQPAKRPERNTAQRVVDASCFPPTSRNNSNWRMVAVGCGGTRVTGRDMFRFPDGSAVTFTVDGLPIEFVG